ncbi:dihydrolipoyl dehydrogenase [Natroniella acetigena]|uniref:dihydrolipoyl dehydrogenase n=1 Tax=Natroniella acetigena TaxID=52004 RepID=UPI00200B2191|nr:dihydrolipoyl dehydrogenase [Natroniella acetigena]MCK8827062.1 dihydrolipoyl dehydrogenase [Natroniella acetigena]
MPDRRVDVVVIGGGPGGYPAAIRAAQKGKKVILIEEDKLGGTCLNRGCIPTKALLKSAEVVETIKQSKKFGVEVTDYQIDFAGVMKWKDNAVNKLVQGIGHLMKSNQIEVINGYGEVVSPGLIKVKTESEKKNIKAENIILAMGSKPASVPIPGVDGSNVITSKEALKLKEIPNSLIIIGGGVIGVEFASVFSTLGSEVTIIEMMDRLIPREDKELGFELEKELKKKGIKIKTNAQVKEINGGEEKSIKFSIDDQEKELEAAQVLISVGRKPNINGIEALNLKLEQGEIPVNKYLETEIKGVYAIGDLLASPQLAHVATAEGLIAAENICGENKEIDYKAVPRCIYTHPEVAAVGLTEEEAIEAGYDLKIGKFPFAASGKATVMGESNGFVKIITDKEFDEILGVHIIGPHATELISETTFAINLEAIGEELAETIHPHPTLSESIMEAAHALNSEAIHIP